MANTCLPSPSVDNTSYFCTSLSKGTGSLIDAPIQHHSTLLCLSKGYPICLSNSCLFLETQNTTLPPAGSPPAFWLVLRCPPPCCLYALHILLSTDPLILNCCLPVSVSPYLCILSTLQVHFSIPAPSFFTPRANVKVIG